MKNTYSDPPSSNRPNRIHRWWPRSYTYGILALAAVTLGLLTIGQTPKAQSYSTNETKLDSLPRVEVVVEGYDPYGSAENYSNLICFNVMLDVEKQALKALEQGKTMPLLECKPYKMVSIHGHPARLLSFAGDTAADVLTQVEFHELHEYVDQGFLMPINQWIGSDDNNNGYIEDAEMKAWDDRNFNGKVDPDEKDTVRVEDAWPGWKSVPKLYRQIAQVDGKIYAIPDLTVGMGAMLYRKDLFRQAGLDPEKTPKDWNELLRYAQILTDPDLEVAGARIQMGRYGMLIEPRGWRFVPFVWAAGGEVMMQSRKDPKTDKVYWFAHDESEFVARDKDGKLIADLSNQPTLEWKITFDDQGGKDAIAFYHRLRWQKWIRGEKTWVGNDKEMRGPKEPINLTEAEALAGQVVYSPDKGQAKSLYGKTLSFNPDHVITGCIRVNWGESKQDTNELFRRGEVVMGYHVCTPESLRNLNLPPENIGLFPVPPRIEGGSPAMVGAYHWKALNARLLKNGMEQKRKYSWRLLSTMQGPEGAKLKINYMVKNGMAQFLDPEMLKRFGFEEYLQWVPESWKRNFEQSKQFMRPEPYVGYWKATAQRILGQDVIEPTLNREDADYEQKIIDGANKANLALSSTRDENVAAARPYAWIIAVLWVGALVGLGYMLFGLIKKKAKDSVKNKAEVVKAPPPNTISGWIYKFAPALMLAPAVGLIAIYAYFPLARGTTISFMEYRLFADSDWVSLDNYIRVFMTAQFYKSLVVTLKYVALSLFFGFLAPIILALLLSEAPWGKTMFRTIFFLPQVSSSLVVLFIWKMMYNPTKFGFLNQMAGLFGFEKIDWLGSKSTAMMAVIIPGIWFGMGMGSLIYLAALRAVPEENYEAAEVDGAGIWAKLWHITIPTISPLIFINFTGAFIGTFHGMGNILAMTGGGPEGSTEVLSLTIWLEAFQGLNFGFATAMAWVLGSMLLGFTVIQLRLLTMVDFRRAEA